MEVLVLKTAFYLVFLLFAVMATMSLKASHLEIVQTQAWDITRGILAILTLILAVLALFKKINFDTKK